MRACIFSEFGELKNGWIQNSWILENSAILNSAILYEPSTILFPPLLCEPISSVLYRQGQFTKKKQQQQQQQHRPTNSCCHNTVGITVTVDAVDPSVNAGGCKSSNKQHVTVNFCAYTRQLEYPCACYAEGRGGPAMGSSREVILSINIIVVIISSGRVESYCYSYKRPAKCTDIVCILFFFGGDWDECTFDTTCPPSTCQILLVEMMSIITVAVLLLDTTHTVLSLPPSSDTYLCTIVGLLWSSLSTGEVIYGWLDGCCLLAG